MQIRFTPHKLRASKAYISNLMADNNIIKKEIKKIDNKKESLSLFGRFLKLFR